MMHKTIFRAVGVAFALIITGCTPTMTYYERTPAPTPAPPAPAPQPRVVAPAAEYKPAAQYAAQKDTLTEERTVVDVDKYIEFTPKFLTTSTIADLEVSDKRVTGAATGPFAAKDILEREAVAKAIAQKDGTDLLAGSTFFYKTASVKVRTTESFGQPSTSSKSKVSEHYLTEPYLTVTVTGYPARYVNFRPYNAGINSQHNRSDTTLKSGPVVVPQLAPR